MNGNNIELNENTKAFCLSWNKSRWENETFAVGCNHNRIFIFSYLNTPSNMGQFQLNGRGSSDGRIGNKLYSFGKQWFCVLKIELNSFHSNSMEMDNVLGNKKYFDVRSICWAAHMARKYHLIGIGCSDGSVRILRITRNCLRKEIESDVEMKLEYEQIFCSCQHQQSVWKVRWNITGTVLLSAGDDGNMFSWKRNRMSGQWSMINIQEKKVRNADFLEAVEVKNNGSDEQGMQTSINHNRPFVMSDLDTNTNENRNVRFDEQQSNNFNRSSVNFDAFQQ